MNRSFARRNALPGRKTDKASRSENPGPGDTDNVSRAEDAAHLKAVAPEGIEAATASRRQFLEAARDGALILDWNSGAITDANSLVTELLGFTHSELIGKALWDLGLPQDADVAKRAFRRLLVKRYLRHEDLPLVTKGGLPITVEVTGIIYRLNGEDVIQCNIRDGKDAGHRGEPLLHVQTMDEAGQLVGGVAHDFNHLVGVILGFCEALEMRADLPDDARQTIQGIHNVGISARNLTQRLLAFSRRQAQQPTAVDLNRTVIHLEKTLGQLAGEKVQLEWRLSSQPVSVKTDSSQMEQVLMNLVINARDAMPEGGKIVIETADVEVDEAFLRRHPSAGPGRYAMLRVSDRGVGMDLETQARIFEPFFSTKPAGQGTGLGLSTVKAIVHQSSGAIEVASEPGAGATFTCFFPQCGPAPQPAKEELPTPAPGGSETILLVEDSDTLRGLMRRILTDSGYAVLESGDPAEALRMAEAHAGAISLVIADLVLPRFSGSILAEKLAAIRPAAKVLFASGFSGESVARLGSSKLEAGFLEKPFTREQLLEKVRQVIDSAR
jgi:PAS domain S-box-containing protein